MKNWKTLTTKQKWATYNKTYAAIKKNPLMLTIHAAGTIAMATSLTLYFKNKITDKTKDKIFNTGSLIPSLVTMIAAYVVCTTDVDA